MHRISPLGKIDKAARIIERRPDDRCEYGRVATFLSRATVVIAEQSSLAWTGTGLDWTSKEEILPFILSATAVATNSGEICQQAPLSDLISRRM